MAEDTNDFRSRGPRPACVLAAMLLSALLLAGCHRGGAGETLRRDIAAMQAAIEARDVGAVAGFLATDFVGNEGFDRDGARRLATLQFLRNADVGVVLGPLDVQLQDGHATVRTTVLLTGGRGGLLPERGRARSVTSGWRRDGDDWKMTSLAWEE